MAFLFPGQGAQYPQMGRHLYENEPEFQRQVDRCCQLFQPWLEGDLRELLYGETDALRLKETVFAQSALFTVEYALAKLWESWGIRLTAVIGHSIGEYAAACFAGVFALEDAIALVAQRGQLMQSLPPGAMLSVALSPAELEPLLEDGLAIAAINTPEWCVVSGETEAIAAFQATLSDRAPGTRRLPAPAPTPPRPGRTAPHILHAWSLPADCRDLDRSFYSLLFLARALGNQEQQQAIDLVLLSSQLYDVTGRETLCPEKATLQGPCRVISQEYPQIRCKIVDIEPESIEPPAIAQLYAELTTSLKAGARAFSPLRLIAAMQSKCKMRSRPPRNSSAQFTA